MFPSAPPRDHLTLLEEANEAVGTCMVMGSG